MKKPIISIRKYTDNGVYSYALFRSDVSSPIIKNISLAHCKHIKHILNGMSDLPYKINPIANWFDFDHIVDV
jgi:hypothetical protein